MKILNVGCGNETYGTHFVDLYPSRSEVIKCDLDREKLPFKDNSFDEVYTASLLEHLRNVGAAVKEMARVLKKNGKLILITDNANYWVWSVGETHLGGYHGLGGNKKEDRHYSLFTEDHLRNHFKKAGLKVESIEFVGETFLHNNPLIHSIKFLTNRFLRSTPLRRMGYAKIKIIGKKI